jgi:hypothetical protein
MAAIKDIFKLSLRGDGQIIMEIKRTDAPVGAVLATIQLTPGGADELMVELEKLVVAAAAILPKIPI